MSELAQTLAERGQQIADTEARLQNLQSEVGLVAARAVSGLQPGRYLGLARSVPAVRIEALFAEDGRFALTSSGRDGSSVTGQYELANGEVILSEAEGDLGTASFPMRCAIEPRSAGFSILATADDLGCALAGVVFHPAD